MSLDTQAHQDTASGRADQEAGSAPGLATLLIALLLSLAFLIPARLVFAPLGAAGVPAMMMGWGLFVLWLLALVRTRGLPAGPQPIRWALVGFLLVQLLTYAAGYLRGLPPIESRSADRTFLLMLAAVGIGLFVADGLRSRSALRRIVGLLVFFALVQAVLAFLQFFLQFDAYASLSIPGLTANQDLLTNSERGDGVARVAGTMTHYIELGVVLAMVAPLAIHQALFAASRGARLYYWLAAIAIISAVPLSVSRSGVVVLAIALATLAVVWNWHLKIVAGFFAFAALAIYPLFSPGLTETLGSLFVNASEDPSISGRTSDYEVVFPMIWERPWLGRGLGTFLPSEYVLLDNEYLLTTVSGGLIGLAGLVGLFAVGWLAARSVRRRGPDDEWRHLGQALAAVILGAAGASFLFDSLSFTVFRVVLFLAIGLIGAAWRLSGTRPTDPLPDYRPDDRVKAPLFADLPSIRRTRNAT